MSNFPLSGVQVFSDPWIPKVRETHRQERKWAHRCMWKKGQRFKVKTESVVVFIGGNLFCHPENVEIISSMVAK